MCSDKEKEHGKERVTVVNRVICPETVGNDLTKLYKLKSVMFSFVAFNKIIILGKSV